MTSYQVLLNLSKTLRAPDMQGLSKCYPTYRQELLALQENGNSQIIVCICHVFQVLVICKRYQHRKSWQIAYNTKSLSRKMNNDICKTLSLRSQFSTQRSESATLSIGELMAVFWSSEVQAHVPLPKHTEVQICNKTSHIRSGAHTSSYNHSKN